MNNITITGRVMGFYQLEDDELGNVAFMLTHTGEVNQRQMTIMCVINDRYLEELCPDDEVLVSGYLIGENKVYVTHLDIEPTLIITDQDSGKDYRIRVDRLDLEKCFPENEKLTLNTGETFVFKENINAMALWYYIADCVRSGRNRLTYSENEGMSYGMWRE